MLLIFLPREQSGRVTFGKEGGPSGTKDRDDSEEVSALPYKFIIQPGEGTKKKKEGQAEVPSTAGAGLA